MNDGGSRERKGERNGNMESDKDRGYTMIHAVFSAVNEDEKVSVCDCLYVCERGGGETEK